MTDADNIHLIIATGGTGGHFYPALAVARECRIRGHDVTLVIAGQQVLEHRQQAVADGFKSFQMRAPKLPSNPLKGLTFPFSLHSSYRCASRILTGIEADVVLGMGSFACFPLCVAAARHRIPLLLHEGNAVAGKANRLLSYWARGLANSFPLAGEKQPRCQTILTGLPVRKSLVKAARNPQERDSALTDYGLSTDRATLLIFGGSQGAKFINDLACRTLSGIQDAAEKIQVIHITGEANSGAIRRFYDRQGIPAHVAAYEHDIEQCYQASDLAVCRAGASSVAELALFGLPGIFIPLPTAADQHQAWNARTVLDCNGGYIIDQTQADPEKNLRELLSDWQKNPQAWKQKHGRNIQELAQFDAAAKVVDLVEKTVENS